MKRLVILMAMVGLLAACAAPATPVSQPAVQQSLPEVIVFRSPT